MTRAILVTKTDDDVRAELRADVSDDELGSEAGGEDVVVDIEYSGINYKDAPDNARRFLNRYGNPFSAAGVDDKGRSSIDWGVYGVPETFLIGRDGKIAYKLVGPITAENLVKQLGPEIEKALAKN